MAANKAKRSIHLAQPHPQITRRRLHPEPAKAMPVKAHVYRTMAEMNAGLEQAIHGLRVLQDITFLPAADLSSMHNLLSRIRAQANRRLMAVLDERETANAGHYQQLQRGPDEDLRENAGL
jgi:hypothetical protein